MLEEFNILISLICSLGHAVLVFISNTDFELAFTNMLLDFMLNFADWLGYGLAIVVTVYLLRKVLKGMLE